MAEDIKSLDQLKDAVTANAGGVLGSSSAEAQSLSAAPREPQRDAQGRAYATGRRKDAVARVWLKPGSGKITINGRDQEVYFARPTLRLVINQVFGVAEREGQGEGSEERLPTGEAGRGPLLTGPGVVDLDELDLTCAFCGELLERGLVANPVTATALRFAPPYTVTDAEIDALS